MGSRSGARRVIALVAVLTSAAALGACGGSGDDGGGGDAAAGGGGDSGLRAVDVAEEAGIAGTSQTHGENCVADFDGDGATDLLLSNHEQPWQLYRGLGEGRFEASDALVLEPADRHGCAVADFDANGKLDIYFSIGACEGGCQAPKELWLQQADGTFVESAEAYGITDPGARGRVPVAFNADGDELADLFTGADASVDFPSVSRVWVNRGGRFEEAEAPFTEETGNLCAANLDIDADGFDELAICTPDDGFAIYRNEGGTLVEDTESFGIEPFGRRTVEFVDIDLDGAVDLVTVARSQVQVHLREGDRFSEPVFTYEVEDGKDVAFGDVDGDGDLDMYVQEGIESDQPDVILLNDGDGRSFELGPEVPDTDEGGGDAVTPIQNWRGEGRVAFIVNNGFQDSPGPRQLIEVVNE